MMGSGEKALIVSCPVSFVLELMKVSGYTGVQYIKERSQGWGVGDAKLDNATEEE